MRRETGECLETALSDKLCDGWYGVVKVPINKPWRKTWWGGKDQPEEKGSRYGLSKWCIVSWEAKEFNYKSFAYTVRSFFPKLTICTKFWVFGINISLRFLFWLISHIWVGTNTYYSDRQSWHHGKETQTKRGWVWHNFWSYPQHYPCKNTRSKDACSNWKDMDSEQE